MDLGRLIAVLAPVEVVGPAPTEIRDLAYDARAATPGSLFFCVPGERADGHDFAPEAVANGAVALVVQRQLDLPVPQLVVEDSRAAMALAADEFFGRPTSELTVAGVTGTAGKTTTAFLLYAVLAAAGRRPGLLGTIETRVNGERRPATRTTAEAIDLQRLFREMLDAGDRSCAMEATSHGSALRRLDYVRFSVLVFTNLDQDHLDFHEDMEDYFDAKRRLFLADPAPPAAVNLGNPWGRRLADELRERGTPLLTYGLTDDAEIRPATVEVDTKLVGRFNLENVLGTVAAARLLGLPDEAIATRHRLGHRRPRAVPVGGRGTGLRGDRRLRPQAGRARERPPHGARAGRRPADHRLRLRRRPGPRQAAADGADRDRALRRRDRHLGQSRAARIHRRSSRRSWPARPASRRSSPTARGRSGGRSTWPGPATSS